MNEQRPRLGITDAALHAALQRALDKRFGDNREIVRIRRQPWDYYSSFTMESLVLEFGDGKSVSLLVKDVGPGSRLATASAIKPAFLYHPLREIETYRRILTPLKVGCPEYFGSDIDLAKGHNLLFLENVTGTPLWQSGDLAVWQDAARWLADFHSRGRPDADQSLAAHLIQFDEAFYSLWPARAVQFVQSANSVPAGALDMLNVVSRRYDAIIGSLLSLPACLIHGEFVASNIIVQSDGASVRVRVVDWEMSAIGPGLMDLADLTAGRWTEVQKREIAGAYRDALPAASRLDSAAFDHALNLCRLHKSMQWLGWSPNWCPPKEHANDWLAEVGRLCELV